MTSSAKWLLLACLGIGPCFACATDTAALAKRLHNAADASSLDDSSLKSWHLKLEVQLYDAKGVPSEQGTIEEWWSPEASKRIFTTPSYTATEISTSQSIYRTKGQPTIPYLLFAALRSVVHPVLPTKTVDKVELVMDVETFGKIKLDCIVSYKVGVDRTGVVSKPPLPGSAPTTCLDHRADQLRVAWMEPEVMARTGLGLFQERQIGIDTAISLYGVKAISEHVGELDTKNFEASTFTPGPDLEERPNDPVWVSGMVTTHTLVHRLAPTYPEDAKRNHTSGAVMLIATIGTAGQVLDTQPVGSPNASLVKSAMAAVTQWIYTPYLVNGVPTSIKTTITIKYDFGPA